MNENIYSKYLALIVSIIAILTAISSIFATFSLTKYQVAQMQKEIIDINASLKVLESKVDIKELNRILNTIQITIARLDVTLNSFERRLTIIEEQMKDK